MPPSFSTLPIKKILSLTGIFLTGVFSILTILSVRGDLSGFGSQAQNIYPLNILSREYQKTKLEAKRITLNFYIPSFDALAANIESGLPLGKRLRGYNGYIDYYEKLTETLPNIAEGYAMLGFLYEQEGKRDAAIKSYQRACVLNPHFFWSYYNLGLLCLKTGHMKEGTEILRQALSINPEDTLRVIVSSKVYQQILLTPGIKYDPATNLMKSYQTTAELLRIAQYLTQKTDPALMQFAQSIPIKAF